jgi:uncharacterized membrane protein YfcA
MASQTSAFIPPVMNVTDLFIVGFVGVIASAFGTLVGGGGLITVPTLILLGIPTHNAIATNRLGATGLFLAGWYKFHKKGMIDYKIGFATGLPFLMGSLLGVQLMLEVNESALKKAIAIITFLILAVIMIRSDVGVEKSKYSIKRIEYVSGAFLSLFIGIYAGFYGPGFATLLAYVLIFLFGQTFIESAATWKIAALLFSVVTAVVFAIHGLILYSEAIALFIGSFIGSYIGAHYSDKIGNVWIKRLFFAVVLIMTLKLLI